MYFKVGDTVKCTEGSFCKEIEEGRIYTVLEVTTSRVNGRQLIKVEENSEDLWYSSRFILYSEEEQLWASLAPQTGIVYGILYGSIKDTDEDLWMIAENIVEALEKGDWKHD